MTKSLSKMEGKINKNVKASFYLKNEMNDSLSQKAVKNQDRDIYLQAIAGNPIQSLVSNLDIELDLVLLNGIAIPIAIAHQTKNRNAYIASNISQYIRYPKSELQKIPIITGLKRWGVLRCLDVLEVFASVTNFDNVVFINAWMLSTNLWNDSDSEIFGELHRLMKQRFPDSIFVFKGLTEEIHTLSFKKLLNFKYIPVFSREVYQIKPEDTNYKKKRPFIIDRKHATQNSDRFIWNNNDRLEEAEKDCFLSWYKELYLEKYSAYNPHYTKAFLNIVLLSDHFRIGTIRDKNGQLLGAQVIFENNNSITTPFIGYDRHIPKEEGIYRLLNYYLTLEAVALKKVFNMSSGAGKFKMQRGGKAQIEYNMLYLPEKWNKSFLPWKLFKWLGDKYIIPNLRTIDI